MSSSVWRWTLILILPAFVGGVLVVAEIEKRNKLHGWLHLNPESPAANPPRSLTLVAFKEERRLDVFGDGRLIKSYPILAASGGPGVKRREGDRQVPEGIYKLTTLNPQSRFHLSIRVDYPDAEDRANGCTGTDIYVHGRAASIGCLAMGDPAIEEIYALAGSVSDRRIVIVPWDLRSKSPPAVGEAWIRERYVRLRGELDRIYDER